jgi:outer membrane murein-binding lipoprotein Lpp
VPCCGNCGELVFDYGADEQIEQAFQDALKERKSAPVAAAASSARRPEEREQAEDREREVEVRNTIEDVMATLQRTLPDMQSLEAETGETVDARVLATIQQLAERVNQLTAAVNQLRRDVDDLRQRGTAAGGQAAAAPQGTTSRSEQDGGFEALRRQLDQAIASRGLAPDRRDRVIWDGPQGRMPVVIIRRGAQNHRVLFPDGKDDKVPASELSPM